MEQLLRNPRKARLPEKLIRGRWASEKNEAEHCHTCCVCSFLPALCRMPVFCKMGGRPHHCLVAGRWHSRLANPDVNWRNRRRRVFDQVKTQDSRLYLHSSFCSVCAAQPSCLVLQRDTPNFANESTDKGNLRNEIRSSNARFGRTVQASSWPIRVGSD